MSKATLALGVSTVGLALATGYLWTQFAAERDRSLIQAKQNAELQARLATLESERSSTATPVEAEHSSPPPPAAAQTIATATQSDATTADRVDPADLHDIQQQKRRQEARKRLLEDPRGRELFKAQARNEARAANRELARELRLTDEEYDGLVELLAEYNVQATEVFSRREGRHIPEAIMNEDRALRDRLAQDIADLLGYEKAQQYAAFDDSRPVRAQVRRLRGLLSEGDALTDDQSARLIVALQKERERFNEDLGRRIPAARLNGSMGTWYGGEFRADSASNTPVREQFLRQMEEFMKRQRQGAAEVLSARQLRAFAQMQDETLTNQRLEVQTMAIAEQAN